MRGRVAGAVACLALALGPGPATADAPADEAAAMLAAWHRDPARIDRARTLLEGAAARDATAQTLIALARAWFLTGDFRAHGDDERLAAYERGRDAARRAIDVAPQSDQAHILYAINSGRWAETKGVMRALATLPTIREETQTALRLNPSNVEAWIVAGGMAAQLPGFLGGDRAKAEESFKRALALDPHQTGGRVELARLYIAMKRWPEARQELQRVVDETAPTELPVWTMRDAPVARQLLESIRDRR